MLALGLVPALRTAGGDPVEQGALAAACIGGRRGHGEVEEAEEVDRVDSCPRRSPSDRIDDG